MGWLCAPLKVYTFYPSLPIAVAHSVDYEMGSLPDSCSFPEQLEQTGWQSSWPLSRPYRTELGFLQWSLSPCVKQRHSKMAESCSFKSYSVRAMAFQ